jgi:hypothetical protein
LIQKNCLDRYLIFKIKKCITLNIRELETRCYNIKIIRQKPLVYSFIDRHDITEISLKVVLNTINLQFHIYTMQLHWTHSNWKWAWIFFLLTLIDRLLLNVTSCPHCLFSHEAAPNNQMLDTSVPLWPVAHPVHSAHDSLYHSTYVYRAIRLQPRCLYYLCILVLVKIVTVKFTLDVRLVRKCK